jgi:hypothetical protein
MRSQARRQLILDLVPIPKRRPIEHAPDGLVQALADLLLEALGEAAMERAGIEGGGDESEDRA